MLKYSPRILRVLRGEDFVLSIASVSEPKRAIKGQEMCFCIADGDVTTKIEPTRRSGVMSTKSLSYKYRSFSCYGGTRTVS